MIYLWQCLIVVWHFPEYTYINHNNSFVPYWHTDAIFLICTLMRPGQFDYTRVSVFNANVVSVVDSQPLTLVFKFCFKNCIFSCNMKVIVTKKLHWYEIMKKQLKHLFVHGWMWNIEKFNESVFQIFWKWKFWYGILNCNLCILQLKLHL